MFPKNCLPIIFALCWHFAGAQTARAQLQDSLSAKSFEYLSRASSVAVKDSVRARLYLTAWLWKAKTEKEYGQMVAAYKALMYRDKKEFRLSYADSMVASSKKTRDFELIGSAFMTRGIVHYDRKEQMKALDDYLVADAYIAKTDNQYLVYKVKYGIAQTKYYLGFYDEAVALFRECIDFFKEENDRAYLNSLHSLGLCYNRMGNYAWCTVTNQTGIEEGRQLENLEMEPYFIHSEGVNAYGRKEYREAIRKLSEALPHIIRYKDFANVAVAYFYMGRSHWAMDEKEKALAYFKKVDAVFQSEGYIRPDLREGYELLIDYYKGQQDMESQLFYMKQLLEADRVLAQNQGYLLKKIVKEYDTRELTEAVRDIENRMLARTVAAFGTVVVLVAVIGHLAYAHFKNRRLFEEMMDRDTSKTVPPKSSGRENTQDITPEIEMNILKKLENFESGVRYLERDMNLARMAKLLCTNTKYVTRVIARHRGKGTIEYIADLKINFIVEKLKTENRYRNYTNKALAEEAGFGSAQNFTRAFKERYEISPTYFISQLKKAADTDS